MALRDQPFLPLYIQDIMTDEKLNECSASTHGIYIKGLMCLMHKSETYGKILLKQKYKQTESKCLNMANQLVKHLPYTVEEINKALEELIIEKVCYFQGDYICQKRMIKDNELSLIRSESGKKGGLAKANKEAKQIANSENESENINVINKKEVFNFKKSLIDLGVKEQIVSDWLKVRKTKKASNTKTAFDAIKKEIEISNIPANDCIRIAVEKSWQGFKSEWIKDENNPKNTEDDEHRQDLRERLRANMH